MITKWFEKFKAALTNIKSESKTRERDVVAEASAENSRNGLQNIIDSFSHSHALPYNRIGEYAPSQRKTTALFPTQQTLSIVLTLIVNTFLGLVTGYIAASAAIKRPPPAPWDAVVYGCFLVGGIILWNATAYRAAMKMQRREQKISPVAVTQFPKLSIKRNTETGESYYIRIDSQEFWVSYADYKRYTMLQDTLLTFYLSPAVMADWQSKALNQKYAGILSCELALESAAFSVA